MRGMQQCYQKLHFTEWFARRIIASITRFIGELHASQNDFIPGNVDGQPDLGRFGAGANLAR